MAILCHRCHGELAAALGESTFCQHCGAPQLRVLEENFTAASPVLSDVQASADRTSDLPVWKSAVGCAAGVAGVSALLMLAVLGLPGGFPVAWLWTVCGGVVVLGLYQRCHPATSISAKLGARVGLLYGLFAIVSLSTTFAAVGLAARFGVHAMGTLDSLLSNAMRQAAQQQAAQGGALALSADQIRTFYSPEVRAGLVLFLLAVAAGFVMLFSVMGGAVGGMMRARRSGSAGTAGN